MKLLVLILLCFLQNANSQQPEIKMSSVRAGILPFKLGTARLIRRYHTFIHSFNFKETRVAIRKLENNFVQTCKTLYTTKSLQNVKTPLLHLLEQSNRTIIDIKLKLLTMRPLKKHERILFESSTEFIPFTTDYTTTTLKPTEPREIIVRPTRRPVYNTTEPMDFDDMGGSAGGYFNFLSPMMTNHEGMLKKMKEEIKSAYVEKKKQESFNDRMEQDKFDLNKQMDKANEKIIARIEHLKQLNKQVQDEIELFTILSSAFQLIQSSGRRLLMFLDNLDKAIKFAKQGIFHDSIANSDNLRSMLDHLQKIYYPSELIKLRDSRMYYQLGIAQVLLNGDEVVFAINFPIVEPNFYDFYRLHEVPYKNVTIVPASTYLAVGDTKSFYQDESCRQTGSVYVCKNPIEPTENDCIPNYIKKLNTNGCNFHFSYARDVQVDYISSEYVVAIPDHKGMDVICMCRGDKYVHLTEPTLFRIPQSCSLIVGVYKFSNLDGYSLFEPVFLGTTIEVDKLSEMIADERGFENIPKVKAPTFYQSKFFYITTILFSFIFFIVVFLLINKKSNKNKEIHIVSFPKEWYGPSDKQPSAPAFEREFTA